MRCAVAIGTPRWGQVQGLGFGNLHHTVVTIVVTTGAGLGDGDFFG